MQLQALNIVLGVEIHVVSDLEFSCRYCLVTKHKNSITIDKTKMTEGTLPMILADIPKTIPVALTLTGKGIIHKNLTIANDANLDHLFQQAFPAVNENDFYVQSYVQNQTSLVSIARKQTVDDLIDKMQRAGLNIFVTSLGAMLSAHIWKQLNNYSTEITFDGHVFQIGALNEFLGYQYKAGSKNEFVSKIGQEQIAEEYIIAYASAFQVLLHQQVDLIHANVTQVNAQFLHFLQNNSLKQKAMLFLFGLFGALLISYLLFSYYNDENTQLSQKLGAYSANADQIDILRKNVSENESLLKRLNWNGGLNYGLLLNEVGESMPRQLQLHELTINEAVTALDTATHAPLIKITGVTDNLTAVNNWIFVLKQKSWIKSVRLLKYEEDMETEQYQFNLMVTY